MVLAAGFGPLNASELPATLRCEVHGEVGGGIQDIIVMVVSRVFRHRLGAKDEHHI
jgi:hypothetical protein